ncbi:hypothetical protein SKAU_G00311350 [Synaphobranchus kaupii]|uniref:Uncharacterized protein n=1 Tax=Synaphobranchus kaupii TaxID=118154 RepID=A0A9Q1ERP5_SYNKA|nr:hypothetical protein SKAU_G00311350 [Synaphobranchus kaupii]
MSPVCSVQRSEDTVSLAQAEPTVLPSKYQIRQDYRSQDLHSLSQRKADSTVSYLSVGINREPHSLKALVRAAADHLKTADGPDRCPVALGPCKMRGQLIGSGRVIRDPNCSLDSVVPGYDEHKSVSLSDRSYAPLTNYRPQACKLSAVTVSSDGGGDIRAPKHRDIPAGQPRLFKDQTQNPITLPPEVRVTVALWQAGQKCNKTRPSRYGSVACLKVPKGAPPHPAAVSEGGVSEREVLTVPALGPAPRVGNELRIRGPSQPWRDTELGAPPHPAQFGSRAVQVRGPQEKGFTV